MPPSEFCFRRQKGLSWLSGIRPRSASSSISRLRRRKFILNWYSRGPSLKWCLLLTGEVVAVVVMEVVVVVEVEVVVERERKTAERDKKEGEKLADFRGVV